MSTPSGGGGGGGGDYLGDAVTKTTCYQIRTNRPFIVSALKLCPFLLFRS